VAEVDDDQLAALRRLRAAFGFVEILEVVDHNEGDDQLLRRLLVVHRLLEARNASPSASGRPTRCNGCRPTALESR
jgi:hypothetical protein